jgi:hypothetical protein
VKRRTIISVVCCAALAATLFQGCGEATEPDPLVAHVGEVSLTKTELNERVPAGTDAETTTRRQREFVDGWVRQELLYQEALSRQLDENARILGLIAQTRRDLLVAALLEREFGGRSVDLNEETIQDYYNSHQESFLRGAAEVRARHILLASQRDSNAHRQVILQDGDAFEKVAREHSLDDDTNQLGGDLGYFTQDRDPILWEACRNLSLNRLSKPQRTSYGYHLIQVLDRQDSGTVKKLAQVRDQIVATVVREHQRSRVEVLIERLKSERLWAVNLEEL